MKIRITKTTTIAPREIDGEDNDPIVSKIDMVIEVKSREELKLIQDLNAIEDPNSKYEYKEIEKDGKE